MIVMFVCHFKTILFILRDTNDRHIKLIKNPVSHYKEKKMET